MNRRDTLACVAVLVVMLPWITGGGCGGMEPMDAADLSQSEKDAIDAASRSTSSLAQATGATQNAADIPSAQENQQAAPGDIEFGSCPVVTGALIIDGGLNLDVTVDFGDGCAAFGSDDTICSGDARGVFDATTQEIALTFNGLSCNDYELGGTVNATLSTSGSSTTIDGEWGLTFSGPDENGEPQTIATAGEGAASYDRDAYVTTVTTFDGAISRNGEAWAAIMTSIVVSAVNNESLIPSGGELTLSSTEIRTTTVRYDENSPVTGDVQVSIEGSPFFTVNLFELHPAGTGE